MKEWVASGDVVPGGWDLPWILHELGTAGGPDIIEVLEGILKDENKIAGLPAEDIDTIHNVIAAIQSRGGMDDETIEKEAYYAEVLSEAGTNIVGHVTGGTGIRVSEKIVYQATGVVD